ncbi:MAG: UDP-3-O-(3-hydroxymyristoyl)glucosamine N-acyltransferase [Deltaproteobacteria bacterium]|nr:UDP-3-O-(3-hydroxymyristoyl)glucosamine N-acyltransferase [Deltaproteobacteria bacterium]MBW2393414.1 UDP-3-O-(3-hydroxymyristoyl)glucosamine N-acyltransferase [Deltaproteobacteria bacterium]
MGIEIGELAARLGGREVEGDAAFVVEDVAGLEDGGPRDLGFLRSASLATALAESSLGAVIAPPEVDVGGLPVIRSMLPNLDFARATGWLRPPVRPPAGIHPSAVVAADAKVDPSAAVGALVVVESGATIGAETVLGARVVVGAGTTVGRGCWLHAGAVIREDCTLGDRVILQPGAAIGGDGFGYEFNERGEHEKVPQVGKVVLEDDVEIGANSTVDRARLGTTRIGRGTKIDNLVMVGHNVEIGAHGILVSQVGLAGTAKLGDRVIVMAQAGVGGHVTIGDGSFIGARGGVIEDLPPGSRVWGFPSIPERAWHRSMSVFARLPEVIRRLRAVEKKTRADGEDS